MIRSQVQISCLSIAPESQDLFSLSDLWSLSYRQLVQGGTCDLRLARRYEGNLFGREGVISACGHCTVCVMSGPLNHPRLHSELSEQKTGKYTCIPDGCEILGLPAE